MQRTFLACCTEVECGFYGLCSCQSHTYLWLVCMLQSLYFVNPFSCVTPEMQNALKGISHLCVVLPRGRRSTKRSDILVHCVFYKENHSPVYQTVGWILFRGAEMCSIWPELLVIKRKWIQKVIYLCLISLFLCIHSVAT